VKFLDCLRIFWRNQNLLVDNISGFTTDLVACRSKEIIGFSVVYS